MIDALKRGDVFIDNGVDAMPAAKRARSLIVGHLDWLDQQISPHLLFKAILEVGGWSVSKGRALIANGVLEGFNDGAKSKSRRGASPVTGSRWRS